MKKLLALLLAGLFSLAVVAMPLDEEADHAAWMKTTQATVGSLRKNAQARGDGGRALEFGIGAHGEAQAHAVAHEVAREKGPDGTRGGGSALGRSGEQDHVGVPVGVLGEQGGEHGDQEPRSRRHQ